MTVLQIFFIFKSEYIIGCTVKNIAQFFNGKDCDVLIFPELIESVLVNAFVNQGILVNNPVPVSLLSGDRKPQIRFLGNHHSGSGNLYHKSFRM